MEDLIKMMQVIGATVAQEVGNIENKQKALDELREVVMADKVTSKDLMGAVALYVCASEYPQLYSEVVFADDNDIPEAREAISMIGQIALMELRNELRDISKRMSQFKRNDR